MFEAVLIYHLDLIGFLLQNATCLGYADLTALAEALFPELEASSRDLHDQLTRFVAAADKIG